MDDIGDVLDKCVVYNVDLLGGTADVEIRGDRRIVPLEFRLDGKLWIDNIALTTQTGNKVLGGFARLSNWREDPQNYRRLGKPRDHAPDGWFLSGVGTWSGNRRDYTIAGWYDVAAADSIDKRQHYRVRNKASLDQVIEMLLKYGCPPEVVREVAHKLLRR